MLKIKSNRKTAFTLTETLITVVILGIFAAILVPNLIKNQVENANRTKVKKAMAVYEKAINMMIIENDIKSTEALRELGQDNCQYTREYFKTVQDGTNNCIFKTADRVWWDITDITNPIISLKDEITDSNKVTIRANALSLEADKTSFALIGRFDEIGTLRVNDNAYEQGLVNNNNNKKYMAKLWSFATNTNVEMVADSFALCKANNVNTCTITTSDGREVTYTKVSTTSDATVAHSSNGSELCLYNRETKKDTCGYVSTAPKGEYWISENLGRLSEEEAKDMTDSICGSYCEGNGNVDYWKAAKTKCEQSGGRLATLAELEVARNNNKLASGWFWTIEERTNGGAYSMYSNGQVDIFNAKWLAGGQVICVGE